MNSFYSKPTFWLWGIISLLLAIFLSLQAISFELFLIFSGVVWILIFFDGILLSKISRNTRNWTIRKSVLYGLFSLVLLLMIGISFVGVSVIGVFTGWGIPHLRTNIITGECTLNQSNDRQDAWYFRHGCDIPKEEKVALLEQDKRFVFILGQCKNPAHGFEHFLEWDEVRCSDLIK